MKIDLKNLSEKYQIPQDQKYQIRYADGALSAALTLDEIATLILDSKLTGQEEISIYPKEDFTSISKDPFFYDLLLSLLHEDLSETQKEDVTRVLTQITLAPTPEIPKEPAKKKRGVAPSLIVPKSIHEESASKKEVEKISLPPKPKKKRKIHLFLMLLFVLLISSVVLWLNTSQKPIPPKVVGPIIEYVMVELPPENASQIDMIKSKTLFDKAQELSFKDTIRSYKEAIDHLHHALKVHPQDANSLALLAKNYLYLWEMSHKDDAYLTAVRTLINRSLGLDSHHATAKEAVALWQMRKKEYPKALFTISEVIENHPYQGESHLIEGEIFYENGQYDSAISSLEKALETNPALARCHYLLGKTYLKKNNPEKAYEIFGIGLDLHPEHASSRLERALIEIQTLNQLQKAQGNLNIVTQFPSLITPWELAKANYYTGWIYEEDKQIDFAIKEYKKAMDLDPSNEIYTSAYQKFGSLALEEKADLNINEESLYFVNIGNKYLDENRIVDAIAQYKAAIQVDPKNYLAHYQLGLVSEKQKKWKEALQFYTQSIEAKGNYIDGYAAIAKIHIRYFDYAKAIQFIEKVKSLSPKSSSIYSLSGYYYEQKGEIEKAISEYKRATDLDSDNFDAHFQLALLFRKQRDFQRSERLFLKALKIKPDEPKIQTEVATLYFEQGLKAQAVEHLKKFTKSYPLNTTYWNGLAKLYYLGNDHQFAKETYLKSISLDDQNTETLEGLAIIYDALEQYKEALDTYKRILKIDPSQAKWFFERAKILYKTGSLENSLTEFKLSYQINENYPLSHFYAGRILVALGKLDLAQDEFRKEIKINPHLKDPYMSLGNLMAQEEKYTEAQENYKRFIQLDPSNSDAYFNLGKIHQLQNRFETAIEFFKTALDKNPDRGDAYLHLGLIYKHLDRKADAIEALENYLRVNPAASNVDEVKRTIVELKKF